MYSKIMKIRYILLVSAKLSSVYVKVYHCVAID